ncbi:MAG TPA: MarR family winged helix-turn-helix transcriptional regulator [Gaiella sp.]|uniref:MarR family winged helix-turn-helix transcriptional regulator n=1 Tax=Gaiella sp. TaxID=2663207 RepID=UPI002D7FF0D1|nr:MarR family winged helix-turn-helix transcriptional regulator [Gaiella sp.]HET9287732.1 MarR family winged helix-turn-helix transcriptional regulator [Gaiella sp.]
MAKTRPATEPDQVDVNLEVWARELPDLDLETEGVVERIYKLERYVDATMRETLDAFELSYGEYKLMMYLRYGGPPYRGKPGKLAKHLGLSTGAMTNRLDNMERRGLVRRLDDPDDRRGVIVELTDDGKALWDRAVTSQAEKESIVATALDEAERHELNELLRRLMNAFERHHGPLAHKGPAQPHE